MFWLMFTFVAVYGSNAELFMRDGVFSQSPRPGNATDEASHRAIAEEGGGSPTQTSSPPSAHNGSVGVTLLEVEPEDMFLVCCEAPEGCFTEIDDCPAGTTLITCPCWPSS